MFFSPPRKCWIKPLPQPNWTWNTLLLSLSLPQLSLPVLVRIQAGIQEMRSCTTKLSFFVVFFCRIHGSIQWQTVCPCKSHWSAAKSSLDRRGLCLGPKASPWQVVPSWALARWLSATKGQWRYFLKKYSSRHPKPVYWTASPSLSLSLHLCLSVYTNTDTMPYCRVFLWPRHYIPT